MTTASASTGCAQPIGQGVALTPAAGFHYKTSHGAR